MNWRAIAPLLLQVLSIIEKEHGLSYLQVVSDQVQQACGNSAVQGSQLKTAQELRTTRYFDIGRK